MAKKSLPFSKTQKPICSIVGCSKSVYRRGMCRFHYREALANPLFPRQMRIYGSSEVRFWHHVQKTESCWLWIGSINNGGYGTFRADRHNFWLAHRYSYFLAHGEEPCLNVLHTCDTPACVRPEHLYEGTHLDNARDREERKRGNQPKGSAKPNALVTEEEVLSIRLRAHAGESAAEIARDLGLNRGHVNQIVLGRSWKELPLIRPSLRTVLYHCQRCGKKWKGKPNVKGCGRCHAPSDGLLLTPVT